MTRPLALTIVVVLQWAAAIIAVISGFDLIAAAFELGDPEVIQQIDGALVMQGIVDVPGAALVTAVFVAGVLLLAVAVVRVMAALYLARGRAWARILVAVFASLNLAGGLAFLFQGFWVRALITVVIELAVFWLLFNPQSSQFIREQSA